MKSISIQYQELKEGKMDKFQFLRNAKMMFPSYVTNYNSFEDSVKILKNRGMLTEGDAVKGVPDKAPEYKFYEKTKKYKKVEQEPEVAEQDGIYPATTLTDIPKVKVDKKVKSIADGLQAITDNDTKNGMKKIKIIKDKKTQLKEGQEGNTISSLKVIALAKKAGKSVLDAKDALEDLVVAYGDNVPKSKVKEVLANYDILISDLKESKKT